MDSTLTLTTDMILVLALMLFAMTMFVLERLRPDLTALTVLVVIGMTGLVDRDEVFSGFSGDAVISVIASMILGAGLERTGALNRLAIWLLQKSRGDERRMIQLTTAIAGLTSPTMQNPSILSLFMPVAARLSARTGVALSRLLLPIACAIIMGGSLTMVGNSPLIMLNDLMASANRDLPSGVATLQPFLMFAPFPIGVALIVACLLYFRYYGDRRLRDGVETKMVRSSTESYFASTYGIVGEVYEMTVTADSALVGLSVGSAEAEAGAPLFLALKSGNEARLSPPAEQIIWVNDVIGVMGPNEQVHAYAKHQGLRIWPRLRHFADLFDPNRAGISEAVVPPTSRFIGHNQAELQLRKRYGISLLAINRERQVFHEDVRNIPLRAGDMLVLHSDWRDLAQAVRDRDFVVVTDYPKGEQRPHKLWVALLVMAAALGLALTAELPTSLALMAGAAGMLIAGVLNMDEAYAAVSWKTVFLMACLLPLGWAMDRTGTADWLAQRILDALPHGIPIYLLQLFVAVLTTLFSLMMSQVGATVVMVPMAINLAIAAGGDPASFALVVALSASNNLVTLSNPVLPMVAGPAGYSRKDLWRVGGPLSLVYLAVVLIMVNLMAWWRG